MVGLGIVFIGREIVSIKSYNKSKIEIFSKLWLDDEHNLKCPKCGGQLILIQADPIEDFNNPYTTYETVVECSSCSFHTTAESFTILGSVKDFNVDHVEIAGWSPSGSRFISKYEHFIDYNVLNNLKKTGEIVEFLVVDSYVVQVIG